MRHLNPIPTDMVEPLCARIEQALADQTYNHTIRLELMGFRRDKTPWDAGRLANILAHYKLCPELVKELDVLAKAWGGLDVGRVRETRRKTAHE